MADISVDRVRDIADIRKLVEAHVMTEALRRDEGEVRRLARSALDDMTKAARYDVMSMSVTAHMDFHRAFYAQCGNEVLAGMWDSWAGQLQLFFPKDHSVFSDLHAVMMEHEHLLGVALHGTIDELTHEVGRHVHGAVDPSFWKRNPPEGGHLISEGGAR